MSDGTGDGVVHITLGNTWHYSVGPTKNVRRAKGGGVACLKMGLVGLKEKREKREHFFFNMPKMKLL